MGKNEIKLNKKMRMWNKYKNLVYVCVGVVAAVVVCIAAYKGITGSSDNTDKKSAAQTTVAGNNTTQSTQSQNITQQTTMQNTTVAGNAAQTTIAGNTQQTTMANTTQAAGVTPLTLAGPAQAQEYTSRDYYNGSIFIGDSIIDGIAYYNYIDSAQIYADGNNTTDKTEKYLDDIIKLTPARVFIMVGLNDANYGTRSAQTIAENIMAIASQIKTASPNTNVCVLSLLPITQEFEAKANVNAKQSVLDEINNIVMAACPSNSVTYVDVATAFKDTSGYMNPQYTGNGSNIYNEYYPFLLNGIAGVVK